MMFEKVAYRKAVSGLDGSLRELLDECKSAVDYEPPENKSDSYITDYHRSWSLICSNDLSFTKISKCLKVLSQRFNQVMGETSILLFKDEKSYSSYFEGNDTSYRVVDKFLFDQQDFYVCINPTSSIYLVSQTKFLQPYSTELESIENVWNVVVRGFYDQDFRHLLSQHCQLISLNFDEAVIEVDCSDGFSVLVSQLSVLEFVFKEVVRYPVRVKILLVPQSNSHDDSVKSDWAIAALQDWGKL